MSEFTQNITSSAPNILFDPLMAGKQQAQTNALAGQQIDISNANMEQVARASAGLLSAYPDEASRAAAYPRVVGMLQSQGFAKQAPATYPGEATLKQLVAMGVSSEKQFEYGAGSTAAKAALGALGIGPNTRTSAGTTTTPGTGTAAAPGVIEPAAFNNATAVRDGLIKRGMDPDTATALSASALHESVANPRTGRGDNGNAAGLMMWTGPRLQAYIDKTGHPPDGAPLDEQLDFIMHEWNGSEAAAAAKVAAAQGVDGKAAAVSQYYLRPKDTQGEMQRRSATALQLQRQLGSTAQPGAPGGATAPGVAMGDATRPDLAPPPPGGTAGIPAPYQATGGGIGAVLGGSARVARPTSPVGAPVITDQPAGGAVVAGPPGTAVVGQPTPPSAAVPGDVGAINAGIARRGGAPAVAAQPEPGWGTVIGQYGPQNQLTPPPPPATPAAAPPAATTAPASTAPVPVPQVPLEPLLQLHPRSGLTPEQHAAAISDLNQPGLTPTAVRQIEAHYQQLAASNLTANQSIRSANRQAQNDAQAQQQRALENERAAETQRLAQEAAKRAQAEADVKARQAADPIQGTDDKANADRTLFRLVGKMNDGSATQDDRRLYAEAAQYYLKPQMQWISDPSEPTKQIMVPVAGQLPYGFPHPSFQPAQPPVEAKPPSATKTDFKPLPENERKVLVETSSRLDQLAEQRSTFKPVFAGFGTAALGDLANAAARNLPASPIAVARADWWQNYQRMKLAVRQGISGQSLTASELAEFDKADINPGMSPDRITANLTHQDRVLRTAHERRVRSLAADRYSPDAIKEAGGVDPATAAEHPAGASTPASPPAASPPPPGFKVIVP